MMKKSEFSLAETSVAHKPTQKKNRSQAMKLDGLGINISTGRFFQNSEITTNLKLVFLPAGAYPMGVFYETYTPDCRNCASMGRGLCVVGIANRLFDREARALERRAR